MHAFTRASVEAFETFLVGIGGDCVRYRDRALPVGCTPPRAAIGFEASLTGGGVRLLVDTGVQYAGENASIRRWLDEGVLEFPDVEALVRWLSGELGPALSAGPEPVTLALTASPVWAAWGCVRSRRTL